MKLNKDICKKCNMDATGRWDENGWTVSDEHMWANRNKVFCPMTMTNIGITKGIPKHCVFHFEQTILSQPVRRSNRKT